MRFVGLFKLKRLHAGIEISANSRRMLGLYGISFAEQLSSARGT
jgi:hypothetical protein